uniref:Uncharacterized protein n=1 Tax=Schizymenia dubyi TaxID=38368 RepID=A0A1C9C9H4_9FLOR|nr:hypothetical protein Schiz_141 [Schizymenia dubyi]AOM65024.1 hypothetical protein Schiz_141 [Schizymenia dubyi]
MFFKFSILYSQMNLLQRIRRLPFVASSNLLQPFINTGLLAIGLIGVVKKVHRLMHCHHMNR